VTSITVIRIVVLVNIDFDDFPYSMQDGVFWTVAEPAIAIINCCIATLRPLLRLISPARLWSSNKSSTTGRIGESGESGFGKRLRNKVGLEIDEYPLTLIGDGVTDTVVASAKGDVDSNNGSRDISPTRWDEEQQSQERQSDQKNRVTRGEIHVQHEYSVQNALRL
jgi:hypothetical protein